MDYSKSILFQYIILRVSHFNMIKTEYSTLPRNARIAGVAQNRTVEMSAEEVITRLKDRISQHSIEFRHAFLNYDRSGKGTVTKSDFRQVSVKVKVVKISSEFSKMFCSRTTANVL